MWIAILLGSIALFLLGLQFGRRGRSAAEPSQVIVEAALDVTFDETDSQDSWEGGFWEASEPHDVATTIEIEYRDGAGSTTRRVVHTRSFDGSLHNGLLIGHCALRDATRTFRFDRILSAVDVATGELIPDLRSHLDTLYASSPERSIDALEDRYRELLKVLLFVAKADGQYRREEKILVRNFCRELAGDPRVTDEMVDKLFNSLDNPSLQGFKVAVGKVLNQQLCSPQQLERVCSGIVDTQDSRTAGEVEALDYLAKRTARYEKERSTRTG